MVKKIIFVLVSIVLVFIILQMVFDIQSASDLQEYREKRDVFFKEAATSPFVQTGMVYRGVDYFAPDDAYKVRAKLHRSEKRSFISLTNSDGTNARYLRFGRADFKIKRIPYSLTILQSVGLNQIFLTAFGDETSGKTTYGGGRYLELLIGKSDYIEIDFNKSYNPFCAYAPQFSCPLPPAENLLSVAINAGEKNYPQE